MPQLDTMNWFQTFLFSWFTLLMFLSKTLNTKFLTKPTN